MRAAGAFIRTWLIAVRPFAYTGSALAVVLGLSLSVYVGYPVRWGLFLVTLAGVVCLHTAANLLNDCFDHQRGLDTQAQPFSGAIVRNLLGEKQVFRGALVFAAASLLCGVFLAWRTGWPVLLLGVVGGLLTFTYTTPGFCLKYIGLGDAAIFLTFGVFPVFGTFWVQTQTFDWHPIVWSVPLVLPTVGILHANNWRDIETDSAKGCRTPAVYLKDRGSAIYYWLLVLGPFVLVAAYFVVGMLSGGKFHAPIAAFLSILALPVAVQLLRNTRERRSGGEWKRFATLDAQTARLHLLFGLLLSAGFVLARLFPVLE